MTVVAVRGSELRQGDHLVAAGADVFMVSPQPPAVRECLLILADGRQCQVGASTLYSIERRAA